MLFRGGVDWADVDDFFLMGVCESLIGKSQRPNKIIRIPSHDIGFIIYLYAYTFALFHSIRQLLRGQNNSRTGVQALVETIS